MISRQQIKDAFLDEIQEIPSNDNDGIVEVAKAYAVSHPNDMALFEALMRLVYEC